MVPVVFLVLVHSEQPNLQVTITQYERYHGTRFLVLILLYNYTYGLTVLHIWSIPELFWKSRYDWSSFNTANDCLTFKIKGFPLQWLKRKNKRIPIVYCHLEFSAFFAVSKKIPIVYSTVVEPKKKISSSLEPKGRWPWKFVCSIGYSSTNKFIQMMSWGWRPILGQGQIWSPMLLHGKKLKQWIFQKLL